MQNLGGNLTIITGQKRILLNCHYIIIITLSVINIISRVVRELCTGTIIISQGKRSPTPAAASLPLQKEKRNTVTQRIGDASYFNFFLGSRLICKHLHYNRDTVNSSNQHAGAMSSTSTLCIHRHSVPHNYLLIVKYAMENECLQYIRFLIFLSFPLGFFLSIRFTYCFS